MPDVEWTVRWWLARVAWLVLWSVGLAAVAAYTGDEPFTAKLVLTFVGLFAIIYAVMFVTVRVLNRIGRS